MPSDLTAELWERDTFQFIVWDIGSGDINVQLHPIDLCIYNYLSMC